MSSNPSAFNVSANFIQPDVDNLRKSVKSILHSLANLKTSYADALVEKSARLNTYLQEFDEDLKDSINWLKANLENLHIESDLSSMEELATSLDGQSSLTEEEKREIIQAAGEIKKAIQEKVQGVKTSFSQKIVFLSQKMSNVKQVVIKERIQTGVEEKSSQKSHLETVEKELVTEKNNLVDERNQLIASLDIMRKYDLFKMFSDYIPGDEEIEKLDISDVDSASIKTGISLYKKALGNISKGLEYEKLAEAKNNLDRSIGKITKKIEENVQQQKQVKDELQDIYEIKKIDAERTKYTTEADKLLNAFTLFNQSLDSLVKIERYSDITQHSEKMVNYLEDIVGQYGQPI